MADFLTVDIDDTHVQARLANMPANVRLALQRKRDVLMLTLEARAKQNAPVGPNTKTHSGGQLRRSIFSKPEDTATSVVGVVATGADTKYARIQELGGTIQIPDIYPTKAKALHFIIDGKDIFVKHVRAHTVTIPPKYYMRDALQSMVTQIREGFREAVVEGAKE